MVLWAWGMAIYPRNTLAGESVPSFPALDARAGCAGCCSASFRSPGTKPSLVISFPLFHPQKEF